MPSTRRELLRSLSTAGALSTFGSLGPLLGSPVFAEAETGASGGPAAAQEADQGTYDFWSSGIRDLNSPRTRSLDAGSAPRAVFVYYDKQAGFVTGSDIGDAGLPDRGDLNLIVNVDHIHFSRTDATKLTSLEGGSLRIDLQQAAPLPSLPERLAWTSIAGFLPDNKKVPAPKDLKFDPGSTWGKLQSVPLPDGGGRWTWNFFLQHRKSKWIQLFDMMRRGKSLLPIFGFGLPAIAITALETIDTIVADLTREANTEWLFQSSDVFVYGTKRARDSFEGSKLRLKQGMYVIVPSTQLAYFSKQASGFEIKDGLIVPKNTRSMDALDASTQALPELTYVTVGISARPSPVSRAG